MTSERNTENLPFKHPSVPKCVTCGYRTDRPEAPCHCHPSPPFDSWDGYKYKDPEWM